MLRPIKFAILVPIINATKGGGIFVKILILLSSLDHENKINIDGIETYNASKLILCIL